MVSQRRTHDDEPGRTTAAPGAQPTVVGSDASLCCCGEGSCLLFFPALHVSPSLLSSSPFSPLSQFSCLLFSFFPPSLLSSRVLVPALLCWALFSSHACAGFALDLRCVRLVCLGLCWACAGLPLSLHRVCSCSGLALLAVGLRWASAGLALGLRWACAGLALGFHLRRGCTPALLVLRLHWTATLRTCFRPPRGPPRADGWRSKTYRAFALR